MEPVTCKLFTPGPLSCTPTVKEAMLKDIGPRDSVFIDDVKKVIVDLVDIAGVSFDDYTAVIMQGCGTYSLEGCIQAATPKNGKVLVIANGAYGDRMKDVCRIADISHDCLDFPEDSIVEPKKVKEYLSSTSSMYSCVVIVHSETTSGVINPVEEIGQILKSFQPNAIYIVDAMSSFGAVPLDILNGKMDYVVSSANKCLQGVPGFSYIIASRKTLKKCEGNSRSLSLDICNQNAFFESGKMFRFTPPTHVILAFIQAIKEYRKEGGLEARAKRYQENCSILQKGMKELGFKILVKPEHHGWIITSFHYPKHPKFDFRVFYEKLRSMGCLIYYDQVSKAGCFRVGHIGNLHPNDSKYFIECSRKALVEMGTPIPVY